MFGQEIARNFGNLSPRTCSSAIPAGEDGVRHGVEVEIGGCAATSGKVEQVREAERSALIDGIGLAKDLQLSGDGF